MRIAAVAKLGYYPTPPHTLALIAQALTIPTVRAPIRLLDPCAGQGEALAYLAQHIPHATGATVTTYGIELADARAPLAAQCLDHLLHADYQEVVMSQSAWGLLFLNPPYDHEAGNTGTAKSRQEYTFLRNTLRCLQGSGVLVYIVPIQLLAQEKVCRLLAANFERLSVWRLPDDEFDQFDQVVIFGIVRNQPLRNEELQAQLQAYSLDQLPPALDTFDLPPYVVPATSSAASSLSFRKRTLAYEEVLAIVTNKGVHGAKTWQEWTRPAVTTGFRPVAPLRTGHVASLISSGQMGTVRLGGLVAKGRCVKQITYFDEQGHEVEQDDPTMKSSKEHFITEVHTLSASGEHQVISTVPAMEAFLSTHGPAIAQAIAAQYEPLYHEPTAAEWTHVSRLMRHKRLPGRSEGGLLPAQKHVAIAAVRSLKAQGWADIVGEMGTGKTCVSLAALDLAHAYPALILCPSHMTEKWAREARAVIPGVDAQVVNNLGELQAFIARYRPGDKAVAVLSKERAKLGPGWRPAVAWRARRIVTAVATDGQPVATAVVKLPACPTCGAFIRDVEGAPLRTPPTKPCKCTACNEPLFVFTGYRRWPLADYIRRQHKGFFQTLIADEFHQYKGGATDQAESYHHLVCATRYTLNLTGTLFGGRATDLFWLRYRIDPAVRRDYAFDDAQRWAEHFGRLQRVFNTNREDGEYGAYTAKARYVVNTKELPGISPAIFSRLLQSCIFLRITDLGYALPAYHEAVQHLAMSHAQADQYEQLHTLLYDVIAAGTGWDADRRARREAQVMLSCWLQSCLSRPNACFREEIVHWSPDGERIPFTVLPEQAESARPGDPPSEPDEDGKVPFILHPIAGALPKEDELVHIAQREARQGRKLILGVRQTGTRDIQPHLQQLLDRAGLRAVILPNALAPAKREAWIEQRVHDIDVLIVNPRKVETGLDLIRFATILCYEPEYSLYTLWQFMRRVWRLGQTQPVRVLFLVYRDTLEEAALALIGEKMKAALLLYGDNAASAITANADAGESSLLNELASRILKGEQFTIDGVQGLLAPAVPAELLQDVETEPATVALRPAPVPAAGALPTADVLDFWRALIAPSTRRPAPKRRQQQAAGQLTFLDLAAD